MIISELMASFFSIIKMDTCQKWAMVKYAVNASVTLNILSYSPYPLKEILMKNSVEELGLTDQ